MTLSKECYIKASPFHPFAGIQEMLNDKTDVANVIRWHDKHDTQLPINLVPN